MKLLYQKVIYRPLFLGALLILLMSCTPQYRISDAEDQTYRFTEKISDTDPEIDQIIEPYKSQLDAQMNAVIGIAGMNLIKEKPESTLGNWVTDAIRNQAVKMGYQVDFATQNYGGLRIGEIPEGEISMGKIFELMPFENYLVILDIKGVELMSFFERIADYGGWPLSSEIRLVTGQNKVKSVTISGAPIESERIYRIALPDYVANGGDRCTFFVSQERITTGTLIRDLLIEEIRDLSSSGMLVSGEKEGRITESGQN
jgi:2',3'-cyclic-nucleotide 2'-phosphodiesterase (5'-nucleotidase family)